MSTQVDVRGGLVVSGLMVLRVTNAGPTQSYTLTVDPAALTITPSAVTLTGPQPPYTFADWLAETYVDRVVLAELQPAEALTVWTALGGDTPNVYSTPFPALIATDIVPGGAYRRLDEVRENDTRLAEVASTAACQATPGSFHLSSAGVLYVHTSESVHPSTLASVAAYFSLFVATAPKDFVGGRLYAPELVGSLPTVSSVAEDGFQAVKSFAAGQIDLVNAHALYDRLSRAYAWRNKRADLFVGGGILSRPQYEQVASLRVDSITPDDAIARLQVRSQAALLEQTVPFQTLTRSEYPALGEGLEGSYVPLLYGTVRDVPGLLVESYLAANPSFEGTPSDFADVYLVADPDRQTLSAVHAVSAVHRTSGERVSLIADDYTVDLSGCTVTVVNATYRSDEWEVRVDATGPTDGGVVIETAPAIMRDLLRHLGERDEHIDDDSFDAVETLAPWPLACWLREPKEASAVVVQIQQSIMGAFWVGRDGLWRARVLDMADDSAPWSLSDEDFVDWRPVERIEPIYPLVRVYYALRPDIEGADNLIQYQMTSAEQAGVRYLYETVSGLTVRTFLRERTDATNIAQRYRLMVSRPETQIDAELRGVGLMTAELFDRASVTRSRAPGGAYAGKRLELVGIEKRLDPVRVRVRLADLGGLNPYIGGMRAISDASLTWGGSTSEQQETLAYIGDDNDEVTDGVTNPSFYW